ncbi:LysR substrate-binding domain-containing protein [Dongia sp.]|uniref:LysR substrate-binding domain-containing protein n=1 Tax=Dongia sp. TaxID=1977262 RepID=UPI003753690C
MRDMIKDYVRGDLPSLSSLLAVVAAGERGGFTAAAQALGVTQSAVSREIRQIEQRLGCALFRRSPRGVELTPEGKQFLEAAQQGLQVIGEAVARVRAQDAPRQLTIGADFAFSAHWLVPRLPLFTALEPQADVRVITAQHVERAIADCDIAIIFGAGAWPGIEVKRLNQEAVFPVCAPNYPSGPADGKPDWLTDANLLRLIDTADGSDWFDWPGYFSAAGVTPPERIRGQGYSNYPLVLQAALAGQGIALSWSPSIDDLLEAGQLKRAHNFTARSTRGYFLARPQNAGPNPMAEAFERWVLAEFGTKP